jgi:hypothetical protein
MSGLYSTNSHAYILDQVDSIRVKLYRLNSSPLLQTQVSISNTWFEK